MHKSQHFCLDPRMSSSFDMLHSWLAKTLIFQLPDANKPSLLFTDASKFCYSGVLAQASMKDSNKALIKILTSEDPLKSVELLTQDPWLDPNIIHPVAYLLGNFCKSQCIWPVITKQCFSVFMAIKKCSFYLQNATLLVHSDHRPLLKMFTGYTDNGKCNTWGLEAVSIPRCFKVQHIKGIANVLAYTVSRLRAVGLYHDLDSKDHQQEFSSPLQPLPPVEEVTHMPIEVNKIFIAPDIEILVENCDLPTVQVDRKWSLENAPPTDIPHVEQNIMSLQEFTPDKVIKLHKNDTFCKTYYNIYIVARTTITS